MDESNTDKDSSPSNNHAQNAPAPAESSIAHAQQCHGEGRTDAQRELEVTIPRGVDDGTRLCLRGEGRAGRQGAPNGDLYIFLAVTEHDIFKREGTDLYCSVPVSFARAALGGMVEIPTIDRKRKRFKIPQGSQSGQAFRLHDQGHAAHQQ